MRHCGGCGWDGRVVGLLGGGVWWCCFLWNCVGYGDLVVCGADGARSCGPGCRSRGGFNECACSCIVNFQPAGCFALQQVAPAFLPAGFTAPLFNGFPTLLHVACQCLSTGAPLLDLQQTLLYSQPIRFFHVLLLAVENSKGGKVSVRPQGWWRPEVYKDGCNGEG